MSEGKRHWSAEYLGLPYRDEGWDRDGVSCLGLVSLVYAEQCGMLLPGYGDVVDGPECAEIAAAFVGDRDAWPFRAIAPEQARDFDLVTFRLGGVESHVGVVAWPGAMLHVAEGITSRIERYDATHWRPLIGRFLRHREAAHG